MSIEDPNFDQSGEEKSTDLPLVEKTKEEIELTPAMQALYEDITAEKTDERFLEEEAEKMSLTERFGVIGKAIERSGKLARRIALVAFAAFSPSIAGANDTIKQVEKNLMNQTLAEWEQIKNKNISTKEERQEYERVKKEIEKMGAISEIEDAASSGNVLSDNDKESYAQKFGLSGEQVDSIYQANKAIEQETSSPSIEKSNSSVFVKSEDEKIYEKYWEAIGQPTAGGKGIPWSGNNFEGLAAFKKGLFKNPAEYKIWQNQNRIKNIKETMLKYPEAVAEFRMDYDKFISKSEDDQRLYINYLVEKYKFGSFNPDVDAWAIKQGIKEKIDPNK